ncbi:glycoside hydrolase family 16 protein [Phlegmacium glaucopus]|nr:glycoside hydrolase family 16 protein [Phlegmacium glaucopus]
MHWSLPFLLSLLPLGGLAGKFHEKSFLRSRHTKRVPAQNNSGTTYTLHDLYEGQSFLNDWEFFSYADPTHGTVNYQTKEDAIQKKLAVVKADGTTILAVDDFSHVPPGGYRDSIRISSKKTYNRGLFIADFKAMPHGCGTWPAYWSVGPDWPGGGEIDIIEGVHNQPTNQYTLHASADCILPKVAETTYLAKLLGTTCTSSPGADSGCAYLDTDSRSYGKGFNDVKGGVFAHLWDDTGVMMWRFFRNSIPTDITAKKPNPSTWGTPAAVFPSYSCDIGSHFFNHSLILDISLCGDYAGSTYANSGCPGTCAQALANATNFNTAKWQINYIAVYQ